MTETKRRRFAERIRRAELVSAPGVYDLISAKLADRLGFDALYMTGYGVVASHLGLPDAGLATYNDMVGRVEQIAAMTSTPLVADGDTGYGGLLNVQHTVRGYEAAGAVGDPARGPGVSEEVRTHARAPRRVPPRTWRRRSGWRRMRGRTGTS